VPTYTIIKHINERQIRKKTPYTDVKCLTLHLTLSSVVCLIMYETATRLIIDEYRSFSLKKGCFLHRPKKTYTQCRFQPRTFREAKVGTDWL